jgi:hypothetical protein
MDKKDLKVGMTICFPGKDDRTIASIGTNVYRYYEGSTQFAYESQLDWLTGWREKQVNVDPKETLGNLTEENIIEGISNFRESLVKDQVKAPSHYANRKYQTILVMEDTMSTEEFKGYLKGNVMKYISRAGKKDATAQELNKAKTYLQWLIEVEETGKLQEVPSYK